MSSYVKFFVLHQVFTNVEIFKIIINKSLVYHCININILSAKFVHMSKSFQNQNDYVLWKGTTFFIFLILFASNKILLSKQDKFMMVYTFFFCFVFKIKHKTTLHHFKEIEKQELIKINVIYILMFFYDIRNYFTNLFWYLASGLCLLVTKSIYKWKLYNLIS